MPETYLHIIMNCLYVDKYKQDGGGGDHEHDS
jgi:hypothetical protein